MLGQSWYTGHTCTCAQMQRLLQLLFAQARQLYTGDALAQYRQLRGGDVVAMSNPSGCSSPEVAVATNTLQCQCIKT